MAEEANAWSVEPLMAFRTTFGAVLRSLAQTYGVDQKGILAFQAKLQSAQKSGLLGKMPGKGVQLAYDHDRMQRMLFAAELYELGITPAVVLAMVEKAWPQLRLVFIAAHVVSTKGASDEDVIIAFHGTKLMTRGWTAAPPQSCTKGELKEKIAIWLTDAGLEPPRIIAVNLSARMRKFYTALFELLDAGEEDSADVVAITHPETEE